MKLTRRNPNFIDVRGAITNITPDVEIRDILYITGKKGAVRGNHYHKKDRHFCYVLSGKIQYEWEDEGGEKGSLTLVPGDLVVNDILEKHRFIFKTDGAFIAMATEPRNQENYESDTVRVDF